MKKLVLMMLVLVLTCNFSFSKNEEKETQNWIRMLDNPKVKFKDVKREFERFWKGKRTFKGSGWKQFKRMEHYLKPGWLLTAVLLIQLSRHMRRGRGIWKPGLKRAAPEQL